jgi:hypothetical protein
VRARMISPNVRRWLASEVAEWLRSRPIVGEQFRREDEKKK